MSKDKKTTIEVKGADIPVLSQKEDDYICITNIARYKNAECTDDLVRNWLRNRNTIEFPGIWEQFNNTDFKPVEFDGIRMQAGLMQDLLTGKKRVTPLLNDKKVASL
ncbi:MAG: KilA-N domain-containing protein [Methanosarcinales archaeon]|nr:KilA-N domain-containing protein [Methanosarcinales archaeon]